MAIDKEQLKEKFKRLSTRYGGSLLTEPQLLEQKNVTVMFGLGGLGCRAVNAIKSISNEKLNNADRRFYRVLDTCLGDMDNISEATTDDVEDPNQIAVQRGCISAEEKIELYDKAHPFTVSTLDSSVDSWIDREVFNNVKIDEKGAQAIRQIGRVMFFDKYTTISNEVSKVIKAAFDKAKANHTSVKIYIIAGISGGTGSGTIIDFSYMVRKILQPLGNIQYSVEGILFTPDVQEKDDKMTPEAYIGLQRNFYAAIKEIDYFYNNVSRGKEYTCPLGGDSDAYSKDIFDECTLVSRMASGFAIANNSDEIIVKLAEALTYEMSGIVITENDGRAQNYNAFYSNVNAYINQWLGTDQGKAMNLPDWIPMRYSSLGYSSFYVPRDELLAYCANRLIERLIEMWNKKNITDDQVVSVMRKASLDSNRSFADKVFKLANCGEMFEVEKSALPKDGLGPLPVKNCESYLETVHDIAIAESRQNYISKVFKLAEKSRRKTFVDPIISEIDTAFNDSLKGPVYAINLLSAGFDSSQVFYDNLGVLVRIGKMIDELGSEAENWRLELEQSYYALQQKAGMMDGKLSADRWELDTFTNDSRECAENLLKVEILKEAEDYLTSIYRDLNDKNNRIFNIYTTTLEFILEILHKDSQYIANTDRKREGQTTIFSFDVANFDVDDPKSKRFKEFFDQVVDGKNLDTESKRFVDKIFGKLKDKFDPVSISGKESPQASEEDIILIVREYFNDCFSEWTDDIIEKFCVIAYSTISITPDLLTKVWEDSKLKTAALQAAADDIENSLMRDSAVMLTSEDESRSVENYTSYTAFTSLGNTRNLNGLFANKNSLLQANWPEFIRFKRVFGLQLNLIDGLKEYKKIYDDSTLPGLHLDEVGDNWRYTLPEPFSYNIAKFLDIYNEGGQDVTEKDRMHMQLILDMAKSAQEYELLKIREDATEPYFVLYYRFLRKIDFSLERDSMYEKFRTIIQRNNKEKIESGFMDVISAAGYEMDKPISIVWTFARPEYNVMKNRTDFGNDLIFGNFITLIRSNQNWEERLKEGIDTFGKIYSLYESAKEDLCISDLYKKRIKEFSRAICVEMVKEYTSPKTGKFAGYMLKYGKSEKDVVIIDNTGWDSFDKKYILYLFFEEVFLKLDGDRYSVFKDYLEKYENEGIAEKTDVTCIYKSVCEILDDPDYLGQYSETLRRNAFVEVVGDARHYYDVPDPSNENDNVSVVVSNLNDFYSYLRTYLERNGYRK